MVESVKKFCTYFASTFTFLFAIKATLGVAFSWKWLSIITLLAGIACSFIVWAEIYASDKWKSRKSRQSSNESIILTIRQELLSVKFAVRDDEAIALQANKIVRQELDKHCIKYREYKKWRKKNPFIFTAVIDNQKELVGFFDIFPLTDEAAMKLLNGTYDEHSLTERTIIPWEKNASAKNIYVASVIVNPKQTAFSQIVAKEILLLKLGEFLTSTFPPDGKRSLFAYAHTNAGERLLKNAEFINTILPNDNKQHDPLYVLSPEGYTQLATSLKGLLRSNIKFSTSNM